MRLILLAVVFLCGFAVNGVVAQSALRTQLTNGISLMAQKDYAKAYQTLLQGAQVANEADSVELNVLFNNNLGALYFYLNQSDSAMFYYHKAFDLAENNDLLVLQNSVLNNMGIVYSEQGFDIKAQETLTKALAISVLSNDSVKTAINHANLAQISFNVHELVAAQNHAQTALNSYKQVLDSLTYFSAINTLTKVHLQQNELDTALRLINKALNWADKYNNKDWAATTYFLQGQICSASHDMTGAKSAYQKALQLTDSTKANQQLEVWHALKDWFQQANQLDSALYCMEQVLLLNTEIAEAQNNGFVEQSKLRFDLHMQQQALQITEQKSKQRIFYSRIIMVTLLLAIALLITVLVQRKKVNTLKQAQLAQQKFLAEEQRDIAQEKSSHLEEQLASINYELMSKSLLIDNKNAVLNAVTDLVNETDEESKSKYILDLRQQLNRNKMIEQNHEEFSVYFERVHANFFKLLHEKHTGLNSSDLRLAAFFLLQFNTKEIANMLHITPDSVRKRKQRLREKMGLSKGVDVQSYLLDFA